MSDSTLNPYIFPVPYIDSNPSGSTKNLMFTYKYPIAQKNSVKTLKNRLTVTKVLKRTTQYNYSMQRSEVFCFDDSNAEGEYFSLLKNTWEEIEFTSDDYKRINIGRSNAGENIRVFIKISDFIKTDEVEEPKNPKKNEESKPDKENKEPKTETRPTDNHKGILEKDDLISFDRAFWRELRKVRGDAKGQPLDINTNGTFWIGDRFDYSDLKIYKRRT